MKEYQSFGFGVNSVALGELLNCEKVFVDTGAEYPETYEYIKYYLETGREVTILTPQVEGCNNIVDWCHKIGHAPFRMYRSCTDKFKIRIMERYFEKPCIVNIGIAYDERHRVKGYKKRDIEYKYPLVERRITRQGCIELIKEADLRVPPKSGCWLCPFQPKPAWWRLGRNHPELFWKAVEIDELHESIGAWRKPGELRKLWPPQTVFYEDEGWECQMCHLSLSKMDEESLHTSS
jgi:hypothetical protein